MSTEATKDWILCRSYRFPNKFYYFNIHNGESKWARPDKKTLLTSDKSKDNCKKPNINLNSEIEPNIEPDDVVGLLGCRGLDNNLELNCNKSLKQDNQKSKTFVTNEKSFPLHSQIHTATITKENKQKFLQQQKKKFNKTLVENHRCFSPPLLNDTEGIYAVNTLNGMRIGQKSFRMYNKPGYNRQRKVIWDPYIKLHSSDSQSEDLTKNALSSITNKMEDINLLSSSSNVMTGENDCDNFIVQHDKKWFIFRDDPQNEEMIKFQTFGRNSNYNDMGKTSKRNMATMKHETKDTCFIVIDLNVLLNDFQFVNDKVLKDTRYRLVIPNAVISKLRNLAEMDHKSHQLMLTAQNLIWKIPTQSRHIILEPEQQITPKQQIISCCKKIKNLDYNLILLTSDADLFASAMDHNLICYMIQDVKEGLCGQLFIDCNIRNEQKDINNNLFLQKPEDIKPLNFSHLTSDVNENYTFFDDFDYEKAGLKETVYEKLKKYSLRNRQIANLIILRAEDYMCTFTQIMETFMSDLLLNERFSCDFCTIPQAVDAVAQLYPDSTSIQIVAYRMSALYNLIKQKNKLETKYKADILIKMVGCGMILVESIKTFKPNSEILLETEYLLGKLLQSIEDPNRFENELEQSKIVRTYDSRGSSETSYEDYDHRPAGDYYNKHLTDLNGNEDTLRQTNFINNRIIRTTGRNLNSLIISNTNGILLDIDKNRDNKIDDKFQEENNIVIKNLNQDESKQIFDSTVHENAFTSLQNAPKVIINFGAIDNFEEKLLNKLEENDTKSDLNIKESNINKNLHNNLDKISENTDMAYQTEVHNSESLKENITLTASNDSGLGKNYCNAHLLIKKFIFEMNSTLNIVYDFINDTSLILKEKDIKPENRREIFDKAYKTYHRMSLVVDNLTNILNREKESNTTVITLLEQAGVDVANDKLIPKYKQIVSVYLEKIDLLQQALKIIYIATNNLLSPKIEVTSTCY